MIKKDKKNDKKTFNWIYNPWLPKNLINLFTTPTFGGSMLYCTDCKEMWLRWPLTVRL